MEEQKNNKWSSLVAMVVSGVVVVVMFEVVTMFIMMRTVMEVILIRVVGVVVGAIKSKGARVIIKRIIEN